MPLLIPLWDPSKTPLMAPANSIFRLQFVSDVQSKLKSFFSVLMLAEEAQGTVEYILILSVVVVGASQLIKLIIQSIDRGILRLGGDLEKDLKTGRAPVSVWKN